MCVFSHILVLQNVVSVRPGMVLEALCSAVTSVTAENLP
jgi:hypothetical protein